MQSNIFHAMLVQITLQFHWPILLIFITITENHGKTGCDGITHSFIVNNNKNEAKLQKQNKPTESI